MTAWIVVCQHEPKNAEARKLLEECRKRKDKEKRAYANVFARAQAENGGDGLYTKAEDERYKQESKVANEAAVKAALKPGPTDETSMVTGSDLQHMTAAQQEEFVRQINQNLEEYG